MYLCGSSFLKQENIVLQVIFLIIIFRTDEFFENFDNG